jgi:hypothetical protein
VFCIQHERTLSVLQLADLPGSPHFSTRQTDGGPERDTGLHKVGCSPVGFWGFNFNRKMLELINYRPHLTVVIPWLLKSYLILTFTCVNNECACKLKKFTTGRRGLCTVASLRTFVCFTLNSLKRSRALTVPPLCRHRHESWCERTTILTKFSSPECAVVQRACTNNNRPTESRRCNHSICQGRDFTNKVSFQISHLRFGLCCTLQAITVTSSIILPGILIWKLFAMRYARSSS